MTDHAQGSDAWWRAKLGKVSASNISNVLMKPEAAGYQNYLMALVCERLTGEREETYTSAAMQNGNEMEQRARDFYTLTTGNVVEQVGFVDHPTIPGTGGSPDGLIGTDGGLELKCVNAARHYKHISGGTIEKGYRDQVNWNLECTGRKWWDYATFCPKFPPAMQMHITRIEFDRAEAERVREAVKMFLLEVSVTVKKMELKFK